MKGLLFAFIFPFKLLCDSFLYSLLMRFGVEETQFQPHFFHSSRWHAVLLAPNRIDTLFKVVFSLLVLRYIVIPD
jgi:hypothetical protein